MSILDELGLDPEDVTWNDLAACKNWATETFFDDYENDIVTATAVDAMCLSCPVAAQCLEYGRETKSWGVWGGVYLTDGEIDAKLNKHKSEQDWTLWRETVDSA
jgi:hypothetical protein